MERGQVEKLGDHRVKNHCHGGQRRNAYNREKRRLLLLRMAGQRCRQGKGRRRAANRGGASGKEAEQGVEAHGTGRDDGHQDSHHDRHHYHHHRLPAEGNDLLQRNADAEQRNTDPEDLAGRELDARLAHPVTGKKIHRHAE
ncbi:hypothetical protein D3C85_753440 [compost metagenome]